MTMKLTIHIDPRREEEVLVYAREQNDTVRAIEALLTPEEALVGYDGRQAVRLHPEQVCCFVVERDRVYAVTPEGRLQMKCRLYRLEERLGRDFVKLNQSCLANVRLIERFGASVAGALTVTFRGGYTDYVSRRQVKTVKERLGL